MSVDVPSFRIRVQLRTVNGKTASRTIDAPVVEKDSPGFDKTLGRIERRVSNAALELLEDAMDTTDVVYSSGNDH